MTLKTFTRHYEAMDFSGLMGLPGFSDGPLQDHIRLYQGYVKNVNHMSDMLWVSAKDAESYKGPGLAEIRRRFGWEFNGMRLHELYFSNMEKDPAGLDRTGALFAKMAEEFGSYEEWKKDFFSLGAMRGIGWVLLAYDPTGERLFNLWINEHDLGYPAGSAPLLVMDVFEHAYIVDYGLDKEKYVAAFSRAIRWEEVERRFGAVRTRTSGEPS